MKVYFIGSVSGKSLYLSEYMAIVKALESLGHRVTYKYLITKTVDALNKQSREEKLRIHKQLNVWKNEADLIVAELSYRSFGVGQEIAYAFRIGKPVFGMYLFGRKPHILLSEVGDRILLSEYSKTNVLSVVREGCEYFDDTSRKRFTMLISGDIVSYLDRVVQTRHMSRSDYIRSLIKGDMGK